MAKKKIAKKRRVLKPFWVYFDQVNRVRIGVRAVDKEEAKVKARRKWRRDEAHARIDDVEEGE